MFDLKAKLLAKGLVTKEQIDKVDAEKKPNKKSIDFEQLDRQKSLDQLKKLEKSEQYILIRKWVDINRLDKESMVDSQCEKFFLHTKDGQVTWLTLRKEIIEEISQGKAGVISYMSNHGLAHAVVPRDIAEDVGQVFPDWLKALTKQ